MQAARDVQRDAMPSIVPSELSLAVVSLLQHIITGVGGTTGMHPPCRQQSSCLQAQACEVSASLHQHSGDTNLLTTCKQATGAAHGACTFRSCEWPLQPTRTYAYLVAVIVKVQRQAQVTTFAIFDQQHRLLPHQCRAVELCMAPRAASVISTSWQAVRQLSRAAVQHLLV